VLVVGAWWCIGHVEVGLLEVRESVYLLNVRVGILLLVGLRLLIIASLEIVYRLLLGWHLIVWIVWIGDGLRGAGDLLFDCDCSWDEDGGMGGIFH
jgi:hypothetical protein